MKYKAVFTIGRNTFLRLEVENFNDAYEEVEEDMRKLAKNMGSNFLYLSNEDEEENGH